MKTVRGVLRPAFQMAVDDDVLHKNPFAFELAGVVVNDSVTREAITKEQMNKFLKFIHDDRLLYESQLNMILTVFGLPQILYLLYFLFLFQHKGTLNDYHF